MRIMKAEIHDRILSTLRRSPGLATWELEHQTGLKKATLQANLRQMLNQGVITYAKRQERDEHYINRWRIR